MVEVFRSIVSGSDLIFFSVGELLFNMVVIIAEFINAVLAVVRKP